MKLLLYWNSWNVSKTSKGARFSSGYPAFRERAIRIKIPANDVENPTSMLSFTKALPSFLPSFLPSSSYLRSSASSHLTIRMKQRARAVSRKGGLGIFEMCLVATRDLSPEMRPIWPSSLLYALKTWRHCCHRGISCTLLSKLSRMWLVCHMINGRDLVPWKQELRSEIPANEWIQLLRTYLYIILGTNNHSTEPLGVQLKSLNGEVKSRRVSTGWWVVQSMKVHFHHNPD